MKLGILTLTTGHRCDNLVEIDRRLQLLDQYGIEYEWLIIIDGKSKDLVNYPGTLHTWIDQCSNKSMTYQLHEGNVYAHRMFGMSALVNDGCDLIYQCDDDDQPNAESLATLVHTANLYECDTFICEFVDHRIWTKRKTGEFSSERFQYQGFPVDIDLPRYAMARGEWGRSGHIVHTARAVRGFSVDLYFAAQQFSIGEDWCFYTQSFINNGASRIGLFAFPIFDRTIVIGKKSLSRFPEYGVREGPLHRCHLFEKYPVDDPLVRKYRREALLLSKYYVAREQKPELQDVLDRINQVLQLYPNA